MTSPHRLNRSLLLVFAVLLMAAGGAGLAAALGAFGTALAHRTLFDDPAGRYVGRHGDWIWPVAAAVAVVLALAALRWLAAQVSVQRAATVALEVPSRAGTTVLRAAAVSDALADQIGAYRGVRAAQARMLGVPGHERLAVAVTVAGGVPLTPLRERIETEAVAAVRAALEAPEFPVALILDATGRPLR